MCPKEWGLASGARASIIWCHSFYLFSFVSLLFVALQWQRLDPSPYTQGATALAISKQPSLITDVSRPSLGAPIAVMSTVTESSMGRKGLSYRSPPARQVRAGVQGRGQETGSKAEALEGHYLVASSP